MQKGRWQRVLVRGFALCAVGGALVYCGTDTSSHNSERAKASSVPINSAPVIGNFVVYAQRSVKLGTLDHSLGGDIGVRAAAAPSFGTQLSVGNLDGLDLLHNLLAPSISLGSGAIVGDVQTNTLTNNNGAFHNQSTFPAAQMPPVPLALAATPGTSNVSVALLHTTTLNPGNYGTLTDNGIVFLNPGTYSFASVTLGDGAQLVAKLSGATSVRVAGSFVTGQHAAVFPVGQTADKLTISVSGNDGPSGSPAAATIGANSALTGLFAAPHGTLSIGDNTVANGAYAGFDVKAGNNVTFVFQSGFPTPATNPSGQQLAGYVTPDIASAPLVGPVPQSTVLHLAIGLPVQNQAAMITKMQQLSDPTNANYRHYLLPADFIATYSPLASSYQAVTTWAQGAGLPVTQSYDNRLLLDVTATAGQIEQALSTDLVYRLRPDGTQFYSLDQEPFITLPATTAINRISGLDNLVVAVRAGGTASNGSYRSQDVRAAYAGCTANTGTGQSVGLMEFDTFLPTDITTFGCNSQLVTCNAAGTVVTSGTLPTVTAVPVDGFSGAPGGGQLEVTVDIDMVIAMAPGLSNVFVYEAAGNASTTPGNDILNKMAANTSTLTFSTSWEVPSDGNTQNILYQMALQGQSFFYASGDRGSAAWVTDPGNMKSMDAVTVVGATTLTMAGTPNAYVSETTWNDANGASGGGIAKNTPSPLYAAPLDRLLNLGGNRLLPDVSMVGNNVFGVLNGANGSFVGTSFATPMWAAFVALANQQSASLGLGSAGFINPFVYNVGFSASAIYNASFNDINDNSTNNGVCANGSTGGGGCGTGIAFIPGTPGNNYTTSQGFDLATGWGTPKCYFLNELGTSSIIAPPPPPSDAGADGAAGSDAGSDAGADASPPPSPPAIQIVASAGSRGVEFCVQGTGFTPGDNLRFEFLNVPGAQSSRQSVELGAPIATDGTFTDFDETFGGGASSATGYVMCTANESTRVMTFQVTDLNNPSVVVTASISNTAICGQQAIGETPLPNPPMFGQTTCPLPPN